MSRSGVDLPNDLVPLEGHLPQRLHTERTDLGIYPAPGLGEHLLGTCRLSQTSQAVVGPIAGLTPKQCKRPRFNADLKVSATFQFSCFVALRSKMLTRFGTFAFPPNAAGFGSAWQN